MMPFIPKELAPYLIIVEDGYKLKECAPDNVKKMFLVWVKEVKKLESEQVSFCPTYKEFT
ncbi:MULTISPECIES: hypothetical protein [Thermoanaerobacterium]|jgi:hypothetical protein|uniref:Uncharacterized protein n=1 Tax=Thermoanaerobacterium butyriciformans TaxID=1702242 RepID=A0ABS4NDB8_9THEO|nr:MULTISPECIES: hypothetical protein [Thermoanaerobacterium]MBE0067990.1 hypothetical protein [Thermoanaerobacterium thermosaccharolyticum]MBE0227729.1 hypothetical protein [Thermoanaerobacterium thermosaccharolyticum]MBP2071654.1 hypothetical protein [Thermoanaerobacterium butyriciformans]MCP2238808.1 hypothetical protein [Thermoanaerobacterium thermosaccharolyticum]